MLALTLHWAQMLRVQRKYLAQFRRARALRHIGREQRFGQRARNTYWHVLHLGLLGFDPRASLQ